MSTPATPMADIDRIERLIAELREAQTGDHSRGCEGRQYACSCGYDHRIQTAASEAADELSRLRGREEEPTHRHLKSGHLVRVIGSGKMQSADWHVNERGVSIDTERSVDMREVVIYEHDGNLWARPVEEFNDGRFVALSPTKQKGDQDGGKHGGGL